MTDPKLYAAQTDLGLHAAEMRTIAGMLAEACARDDVETICDYAQAFLEYVDEFPALYLKFLAVCGRTRPARLAPVEL
jgi:hypothetical protein